MFRLPTPTPAVLKNRLRLQQFWKTDSDSSSFKNPTPDSDSSSFKKPTPTPAENMLLHRLHNPDTNLKIM